MYVGAHLPLDVVAGLGIGAVCASLMNLAIGVPPRPALAVEPPATRGEPPEVEPVAAAGGGADRVRRAELADPGSASYRDVHDDDRGVVLQVRRRDGRGPLR